MVILIFLVFFNSGSPAVYRTLKSLCDAKASDPTVTAIYQISLQEPGGINPVTMQQITCTNIPATQVLVPQSWTATPVGNPIVSTPIVGQ